VELHVETNPAFNTVTAYGHDYIEINAVPYSTAIYFSPEGEIKTWAVETAADINADLLREVAGLTQAVSDPMAFLDAQPASPKPIDAPEVILIGTGPRQHFLASGVTRELQDMGIGIETMDTRAAARTYNILMAEGRRVIAALLPPKDKAQ
jgi:Uncharacterized conserved protein